jgi:hypothetical protein
MLWSVDSDDWRMQGPDDVAPRAERLLRALSGRRLHDIVLFHDENRFTAPLLEAVLPQMKARDVDLTSAVDAL